MNQVTIRREPSTDQGTLGRLIALRLDARFACWTLELPWRDNQRNVSCIPVGQYTVDWSRSAHFGEVYRVQGVEGRSGILIHHGNWAGDTAKGFKTSVAGCILVGLSRSEIDGQRVVMQSQTARAAFEEFMGRERFRLVITQQPEKEIETWHG